MDKNERLFFDGVKESELLQLGIDTYRSKMIGLGQILQKAIVLGKDKPGTPLIFAHEGGLNGLIAVTADSNYLADPSSASGFAHGKEAAKEIMAKSQEMNAEVDPAAKWQVFRKEIEKPVGLVAEGKKATLDSVAQMFDQMIEADLVNNIKYPLWWYGRQYKITIEKWEGTDEPISR